MNLILENMPIHIFWFCIGMFSSCKYDMKCIVFQLPQGTVVDNRALLVCPPLDLGCSPGLQPSCDNCLSTDPSNHRGNLAITQCLPVSISSCSGHTDVDGVVCGVASSTVVTSRESCVGYTVSNTVVPSRESCVGYTVSNTVVPSRESCVGSTVPNSVVSSRESCVGSTVPTTVVSSMESCVGSAVPNTVVSSMESCVGSTIPSSVVTSREFFVGSAVPNTVVSSGKFFVGSTVPNTIVTSRESCVGSTAPNCVGHVHAECNFDSVLNKTVTSDAQESKCCKKNTSIFNKHSFGFSPCGIFTQDFFGSKSSVGHFENENNVKPRNLHQSNTQAPCVHINTDDSGGNFDHDSCFNEPSDTDAGFEKLVDCPVDKVPFTVRCTDSARSCIGYGRMSAGTQKDTLKSSFNLPIVLLPKGNSCHLRDALHSELEEVSRLELMVFESDAICGAVGSSSVNTEEIYHPSVMLAGSNSDSSSPEKGYHLMDSDLLKRSFFTLACSCSKCFKGDLTCSVATDGHSRPLSNIRLSSSNEIMGNDETNDVLSSDDVECVICSAGKLAHQSANVRRVCIPSPIFKMQCNEDIGIIPWNKKRDKIQVRLQHCGSSVEYDLQPCYSNELALAAEGTSAALISSHMDDSVLEVMDAMKTQSRVSKNVMTSSIGRQRHCSVGQKRLGENVGLLSNCQVNGKRLCTKDSRFPESFTRHVSERYAPQWRDRFLSTTNPTKYGPEKATNVASLNKISVRVAEGKGLRRRIVDSPKAVIMSPVIVTSACGEGEIISRKQKPDIIVCSISSSVEGNQGQYDHSAIPLSSPHLGPATISNHESCCKCRVLKRDIAVPHAGIRHITVPHAGIRHIAMPHAGIRHIAVPHAGIRHIAVPHTGIRHIAVPHAGIRHIAVPHAGIRHIAVPHAGIRHIAVPHAGIRHIAVPHAGISCDSAVTVCDISLSTSNSASLCLTSHSAHMTSRWGGTLGEVNTEHHCHRSYDEQQGIMRRAVLPDCYQGEPRTWSGNCLPCLGEVVCDGSGHVVPFLASCCSRNHRLPCSAEKHLFNQSIMDGCVNSSYLVDVQPSQTNVQIVDGDGFPSGSTDHSLLLKPERTCYQCGYPCGGNRQEAELLDCGNPCLECRRLGVTPKTFPVVSFSSRIDGGCHHVINVRHNVTLSSDNHTHTPEAAAVIHENRRLLSKDVYPAAMDTAVSNASLCRVGSRGSTVKHSAKCDRNRKRGKVVKESVRTRAVQVGFPSKLHEVYLCAAKHYVGRECDDPFCCVTHSRLKCRAGQDVCNDMHGRQVRQTDSTCGECSEHLDGRDVILASEQPCSRYTPPDAFLAVSGSDNSQTRKCILVRSSERHPWMMPDESGLCVVCESPTVAHASHASVENPVSSRGEVTREIGRWPAGSARLSVSSDQMRPATSIAGLQGKVGIAQHSTSEAVYTSAHFDMVCRDVKVHLTAWLEKAGDAWCLILGEGKSDMFWLAWCRTKLCIW